VNTTYKGMLLPVEPSPFYCASLRCLFSRAIGFFLAGGVAFSAGGRPPLRSSSFGNRLFLRISRLPFLQSPFVCAIASCWAIFRRAIALYRVNHARRGSIRYSSMRFQNGGRKAILVCVGTISGDVSRLKLLVLSPPRPFHARGGRSCVASFPPGIRTILAGAAGG